MSPVAGLIAAAHFPSPQLRLGLAAIADNLTSLYLWLAATVVLLMVVGLVAAAILKRLRAPADVAMGPGFSLADLRRLRDQGQLKDEEYERAKKRVLAQMASSGAAGEESAPAASIPDLSTDEAAGPDNGGDGDTPPTIR